MKIISPGIDSALPSALFIFFINQIIKDMNLTGKGHELGEDIPSFLRGKITDSEFIKKYGSSTYNLVVDNFRYKFSLLVLQYCEDLKHPDFIDKVKKIRANIALFCAAFL